MLKNEEEKKELVWIPARLKKEFDEIGDDRQKEFLILQYIQQCKDDLKYSIENLDEDVTSFKGSMIKARRAFEDAKNEQLTLSYEMWEKFDKDLPLVKEKAQTMIDGLKPLKNELESINELMKGISDYDIKRLLDTLKLVSEHLSYDGETAKVLRFLFDNYGKKN